MDKNNPGQERAVTDKALSYSFDVDPNVGKVINARVPLLAQDMVIKPESLEVGSNRTRFVKDSIHITFNRNVSDSAIIGYALRGTFTVEIEGAKLILTAKDNGINKGMVKDVLSLLHEYGAISIHGTEEAAKKFGVESPIDVASPKVEMGKPADPAFMKRVFPRVEVDEHIRRIINSRGANISEDPFPKNRNR